MGRVALLNNERYQRLLRNFLAEAHDHLMLFNFVGYYCVKDLAGWVQTVAERDTPFDDQDDAMGDTLPFGVVHLSVSDLDRYGTFKLQQRRGEMRRRLVFECTDEELSRNYDFYVFEHDAAFEQQGRVCAGQATMLVITPFLELWQRSRELQETRCCGMDASFQGSHPESFVIVKPPADTSSRRSPTIYATLRTRSPRPPGRIARDAPSSTWRSSTSSWTGCSHSWAASTRPTTRCVAAASIRADPPHSTRCASARTPGRCEGDRWRCCPSRWSWRAALRPSYCSTPRPPSISTRSRSAV